MGQRSREFSVRRHPVPASADGGHGRTPEASAGMHPSGEQDTVAVEEPLEIRIEGIPAAITMRTPGDDLDLAAGFLMTEGVVDGWDDVRAMAVVAENVVDVRLSEGVPAARARSADRALFSNSSCGICGKASLDRLVHRSGQVAGWMPEERVLSALPETLRAQQPLFAATGGTHAASLFDASGRLIAPREDIGRHNAVDKCIGAQLRLEGVFSGLGLVTTSRAGFEIVQKSIVAGLGCVVSVGAPTSLAIEAANRAGLVLFAWHQGHRWVGYSFPEPSSAPPTA